MATKIEWTQKVWNPVTGCTKVSEDGIKQSKYKNGSPLDGREWKEYPINLNEQQL